MEENKDKIIDENPEEVTKKKKKSFLHRLVRFFMIVVLSLISLNLLLYGLLSIPWVQQRAVDFALEQLKPMLGTELAIDEVRISLFNQIDLKGVYVEDQQKDTLVYAGNLNAKFDLWQFFSNNQLLINSISLDNAVVNVSAQTPQSPFNFQFIIDAFASTDSVPTDTTATTLKIDISDIKISNTRLNYNIWSEPDTIGGFNFSHIHIQDLNAHLALPSLDMANFEGIIHSLSFTERSGLIVNKLEAIVHSHGDEFYTKKLILALPQSKLDVKSAKYNMETSQFALVTENTILYPKDFIAFLPNLKSLDQPIKLQTSISGTLPQISVDSLLLNYGGTSELNANAFISDYSRYDTANINLSINRLKVANNDITNFARLGDSTLILPDMIKLLGDINLKGQVNGQLSNIQINAEALTRQGGLTLTGKAGTDTTFQNFDADVLLHTQNFNLRPFVGDSLGIGRMSLDVSVKAKQTLKQSLSVQAKGFLKSLQYKDYEFARVPFTAHYSASKMGAWIDADLPIGAIKGEVEMTQSKEPKYIFDLIVRDLNIGEFYKAPNWTNPLVSFDLKGDLQGKDINSLLGDVTLDSLSFTDTGFNFEPGIITLQAGTNNSGRYIALRSSICDANLSGKYDFLSLYDEVSEMMHPFLPDIFETPSYKKINKDKKNNFNLDAYIDNTESLTKIIELPLVLYEPLQLHLGVNSIENKIEMNGYAPDFAYNDIKFKNTTLALNCDSLFNTTAATQYVLDSGYISANLGVSAASDTLNALIAIKSSENNLKLDGKINALAHFDRSEKGELITNLDFRPTTIGINNLNFSVLPAKIKYDEQSKIHIENFGLTLNDRHFLTVDGIVSDKIDDRISIFFDHAQIDPILEGFDVKNIGATINGELLIDGALGKNMELFTQDFSITDINVFGDTLGNLSVNSKWSNEANAIDLNLALDNAKSDTKTTLSGLIHTNTQELDLVANIDRFSLNWAQPFAEGILNKLSGSLSANMSIKGTTSAPALDGWLGLNDAAFGIDYTNVTYRVTDTIRFSPDRIGFDYLILSDEEGNYGLASATLNHKNFSDMNYTLDLHLYNLLVLNTEHRTDSLFYGKVLASGDVKITGNDKKIDVDMNVANSRNSNINILLPQTSSASEYRSIVYINTPDSIDTKPKEPEASLPLNLGVLLAVDPRINFTVVLNPVTGDEMHVTGTGNINFTYDLQADRMSTLGNFVIKEGTVRYKQIKTFVFDIQEGSSLRFIGDPLRTTFDITAYRRIKDADLTTLDQSFASDVTLSSKKTDVDCILKISGDINSMDLSYDVDFPEASDDVKSRAKSLISTEEQKIKQFASLVALGTFYSSNSGGNIGDGMIGSIISGTLSSSLQNLFKGVLGNEWEIGTNISTSDASFSDIGMSVNVSRRFLNNKLKLSTNLGYRSEQTTATQNSFVGDFDAEYELTQNWRLKAYNHTNERYYKSGSTTQGIGINYSKDAKRLKELFRLFSRKKKVEKSDNEDNN